MTQKKLTQAVAEHTGLAKCSVRYLRVSSQRQMDTDADVVQDGNSIDAQRKAAVAKERALGLDNIREFVEPGNSAQTIEKRPVFREMLAYLAEHPEVQYVIVYMMSRAFRNLRDQLNTKAQLTGMGVTLLSTKEDFAEGYLGDSMQAVIGLINEMEARRNGEDIKVKMANKARNGGTLGPAPVGYLNIRKRIDGREIRTVDFDPERSPLMRQAFDWFATGRYTVEDIEEKLEDAGLRLAATAKWPARPISKNGLIYAFRNRYYRGEILYDGIWYPGRHEPLVGQDTFDRVQRVLDAHAGEGTRTRKHHHYLKGAIFCGRCQRRYIIQRAVGNGGEYFYWLCRGRQDGQCDQPYIPIEAVEEAVEQHYARVTWLSPEALVVVREAVAAAVATDSSLPPDTRERLERRLLAIDKKEDYYLDLAAEEGWPKAKLRSKIDNLRDERQQIRRTLAHADRKLATGEAFIQCGLTLLERPHEIYAESSESVRTILNKAFFSKLYVDGRKVTGHEFNEPFDALFELYEIERQGRTTTAPTINKADILEDVGLVDHETLVDLLQPVSSDGGWSRAAVVGRAGLEPATRRL